MTKLVVIYANLASVLISACCKRAYYNTYWEKDVRLGGHHGLRVLTVLSIDRAPPYSIILNSLEQMCKGFAQTHFRKR
ncbi:hypothetical protein AOQ84DRAFT_352384, partial [Glonium stellatum]